MNEPNCNSRLSSTQVRNPKLGPDRNGGAWVESVAWAPGESLGLSAFSSFLFSGVVSIGTLGVDLAYAGGVGVGGGDALSVTAYTLVAGISAAMMFFLMMWTQYIAPSIWKPLEFRTQVQRNAYLAYHEMDRSKQLEVSNAFKALMNADPDNVVEANTVWDSTLRLIEKREALIQKQIAVPDPDDVYLEEARHTLHSIEQEVYDMEKMND